MVLASLTRSVTNKLQRVLNAAECLVSELAQILHADLHCLDVPDRVRLKPGMTATSVCTAKCCSTEQTSASHSRTSLVISDYAHTITTWMYHVTTNSAHSVVGHSLSPDPPSVSHFQMSSRDPSCTNKTFRQSLKTFMFRQY